MRLVSGFFAALLLFPAADVVAFDDAPTGKLSDEAIPQAYSLKFRIDPQAPRFRGEARIRVKLAKDVDHLWLHGKNFVVDKAELIDAKGDVHTLKYTQRTAEGVAEVAFGKTLPAQMVDLVFVYSAPYNATPDGLFKATIGKDVYAVTQLEALSGRKVFPGFDEPRFKTPFDVSLTVPKAQVAFANASPKNETVSADGRWKTIAYATTKPLPTYLFAVAVGPWDVAATAQLPANDVRKTAIPLRGIGPRGSAPQLKWILERTPAIVDFYEKYTNQPYPYDKLDLLGTANFQGAMENAGLIIFQDDELRFDEDSSRAAYHEGYDTTAHEIAHQWFGNLVTVPWWDDLWLNEAYATWFANKAMRALMPEYLADLRRVSDTRRAMSKDSLLSTRKVRQPIENPGDVGLAFDDITYLKGAALLRMFEEWVGEDVYRDAMREYLSAHVHGSGSSEDLIATLARVSGKGDTLKTAMRGFLDQPGIPLVRAETKCEAGKGSVVLSQSRYLPYEVVAKESSLWSVPVCARFGHATRSEKQCFLLDQPQREFPIDSGCADWVMPNANAAGYYRFSLSEPQLAALRTQVATLSAPEQLVYADAVSSAFHRGELPPTAVLDAMPSLASSDMPQVAMALVDDFDWIREHLADDATGVALDAYAARTYAAQLAALGYRHKPGEADATTDLRARVIDFLALDADDAPVRQELNTSGRAALGLDGGKIDLARVDPDLRRTVLTVTVQDSGAAAFRAVLNELTRNQDTQQRGDLLYALGATRDPQLGEKARNYALTTAVSDVEMESVYSGQNSEPENRAALWAWYQTHYTALNARVPDEAKSNVVNLPAVGRCSKAQSDGLAAFFAPRIKKLAGGERLFAQAREGIDQCAALREHFPATVLQAWTHAQK